MAKYVDDLDFSAISDDQLIGLVRAALQEAGWRNPAVAQAMRGAVLDEAEKAAIAFMRRLARAGRGECVVEDVVRAAGGARLTAAVGRLALPAPGRDA